jgi:hypothetical protein
MTLTELKSAAYDCLAQIEYLQKKLQEINQEIAKQVQNEQSTTDSDSL